MIEVYEEQCGDRRTVVGREGPVFAGLEFAGFFDVPHRVSINKSAIYGFLWNRIGNFLALMRPTPQALNARWQTAENTPSF